MSTGFPIPTPGDPSQMIDLSTGLSNLSPLAPPHTEHAGSGICWGAIIIRRFLLFCLFPNYHLGPVSTRDFLSFSFFLVPSIYGRCVFSHSAGCRCSCRLVFKSHCNSLLALRQPLSCIATHPLLLVPSVIPVTNTQTMKTKHSPCQYGMRIFLGG
ncbi:hypothetical protein BD324DRAFT_624832 [Kockovaella imperatae]|uniref:Uncharacterized protein n=1 Tax=Kockovaella imperatae TaxID=4999 RepID=A0A1Y1UGG2_9TREE|nr:hypothetical protein BD324DRAFT_624832 [Kockovaella imperatae]ORX37108.1 hypothetical protein BD324DRAFT_624832 [Kockovaella imperatae]